MRQPYPPLSQFESTALLQVRFRAKLEPQHRAAMPRLIHLGLINETPAGFSLTEIGEKRLLEEARKRGLAAGDGPRGAAARGPSSSP